jgi:hypothetical protein
LRNFLWSGGSIWRGIIGRTFWRSTADMLDEKMSGRRKASSISPRRQTITMCLSNGRTAAASRMARYAGWGSAAVSAKPTLGVVASYELIPRSSPVAIADSHVTVPHPAPRF